MSPAGRFLRDDHGCLWRPGRRLEIDHVRRDANGQVLRAGYIQRLDDFVLPRRKPVANVGRVASNFADIVKMILRRQIAGVKRTKIAPDVPAD
jgi:hypothetical protein